MKKLVFSATLLLSSVAISQQIHRCATHEATQHQETVTPGYLQSVSEVFSRAKEHQGGDRATVYTIPVVVHIVYNNPDENLPDSVIFNQIQVLNDAYGYTNADTINLRDTFKTIVGSTDIQFELATIDPDGNVTTGITRTTTDIVEFGDIGFISGDMSGFERIKSTIDGGQDPWDQSRYLNIWVGDLSISGFTGLLGYATPPDNLPNWAGTPASNMSDGVVMQYQAFGGNNPIPLGTTNFEGNTCVHEVGHYLGLRHIWGDGDCTEQDGIDDTPNATENSQNITNCDTLNNTCTDNIGVLGDLPNMQENYMDYSPEECQNAFTIGQGELMRGVIETNRWDLIDNYPALSITENENNNISVYPNPSKGNITISGLDLNSQINIYANNGQLVKQVFSTSTQFLINDLPKGFYCVKIISNKTSTTKKITVL